MTLRIHPDDIVAEHPSGVLGIHGSWERVRLRAIADVLNGFAFPSTSFASTGEIPLIRIRDVGRPNTDTWYSGPFHRQYVVEPGSLIVGMDGDFRADKWSGPPALLNQRVCKITVRDPQLYSPELLRYALPGYLDAINRKTSAVTVKHLSSETIKDLPLPLPPRVEQDRIVAAIEEQSSRLDAGLAALERVLKNLKRMRVALLAHACTGQLTASWRGGRHFRSGSELREDLLSKRALVQQGKRRSVPIPAAVGVFSDLPETWAQASVDELCSVVTDGEHITPPRTDEGVMLLSARNVLNGFLSYSVVDHIAEETYQKICKRLEITRGDVLLSCSGTVGRSAFVGEGPRFALVRSVAVLRPAAPMGQFISLILRSPQLQAQITQRKTQTAQANIFQKQIRGLTLPLPPFEEQEEIVRQVTLQMSQIDNLERSVLQSQANNSVLHSAILVAAFSGKLVPRDPTNEPAPVLLERIAAARASSNGQQTPPVRKPRAARQNVPA